MSSIFFLSAMIPQAGGDSGFFPPAVRGWALAPEEAAYTPEDLYRYIDGASELYISYGFVNLLTRIYQRPGQPDIVVDFFDMGAPANAFGIFAHSQEVPTREIGQDSEYLDGLLRFWQGRYYVSLLCSPETPESRAAVMELGRQLARRLPAATVRPEILSLLPPAGLLAASIRLFHHHAWQNTYRFIADGDILGIDAGAEAVLAKYEQDGERSLLLLVRYPERGFAERAFAGLVRKFNFPSVAGAAVRLDDNNYFAVVLEKRVVAAVWHAGGAAPALGFLAALRGKIAAFEK